MPKRTPTHAKGKPSPPKPPSFLDRGSASSLLAFGALVLYLVWRLTRS